MLIKRALWVELVALHLTSSFIQFYPTSAPTQRIRHASIAGIWGIFMGLRALVHVSTAGTSSEGPKLLQSLTESLRRRAAFDRPWKTPGWALGLLVVLTKWMWSRTQQRLLGSEHPPPCTRTHTPEISFCVVLFFAMIFAGSPRWHHCGKTNTWPSNVRCHRGVLLRHEDMTIGRANRKGWFLLPVFTRNSHSGKAPIHSGPTQPCCVSWGGEGIFWFSISYLVFCISCVIDSGRVEGSCNTV